jgi:hypothetical protein
MRAEGEPIEVEVERLGLPDEGAGSERQSSRPLSPLVFGLILDALDLGTRGPRWLLPGLAVGGAVGYLLARKSGLGSGRSLGLGALCGLYCALPGTAPLPLGTLVGAYLALAR